MMIRGKSCTLTAARDGYFYPLPYSEETIRAKSKGYALPACVEGLGRERRIFTGSGIAGCFVTRLSEESALALLRLVFLNLDFDIYVDRVFEKKIYRNIKASAFELRAENGGAFYLKVDVEETSESFCDDWKTGTPDFSLSSGMKTFVFDGHNVLSDGRRLPLVYRFSLSCALGETKQTTLEMGFPLTRKHFPISVESAIEKISIPLDRENSAFLEICGLKPFDDGAGIDNAGAVLCSQKFFVAGKVNFVERDESGKKEVSL